ncbi:MAG: stage II sporulation protein R [Oscillospiraceae bacterium]|nr:stage II sporulation protein R [Oscillospiraceae bacterium]
MKRLHKWELALLLGLCAVLLWGAWSVRQQQDLSRKMIRLHVIAHSDSAEDQALKLQVRDRVLDYATAVLQRSADMTAAQQELQQELPRIESIARAAVAAEGYDYAVTASLGQAEFPLKEYDGFSLPAGEYTALRLVIGEGEGQNWWCVVFPPLCTAAACDFTETALDAGMTEEDIALITESEGYVLKFRALELWQQLRQRMGK